MAIPRFDIEAQVRTLGIDSLLPPEPLIEVGQIWRELHAASPRYVRVESTASQYNVAIRTVVLAAEAPPDHGGGVQYGRWLTGRRSRVTHADRSRFNGKPGGYAIVEPA